MADRQLRLVLFADSDDAISIALLARCLKVANERSDVTVAAIVETAIRARAPLELLARRAVRGAGSITGLTELTWPPMLPLFSTCASLARVRRIPVLAPRQRRINDPRFVDAIRRLRPDAALSLMVAQIFRAPLLEACRVAVNYHNSLLPNYRGVSATGWSIYEKAGVSGFTFHLMTEDVDGGPILTQGSVPLHERSTAPAVELAKTRRAAAQMDSVFALLHAPFEAASEQRGPGSAFTRADMHRIRTIEQPQMLSLPELELRLRAFERLDLPLAGRWWSVTALRRIARRARNPDLAFRTADDAWVEPARIRHLPPIAYRIPIRLPKRGAPA